MFFARVLAAVVWSFAVCAFAETVMSASVTDASATTAYSTGRKRLKLKRRPFSPFGSLRCNHDGHCLISSLSNRSSSLLIVYFSESKCQNSRLSRLSSVQTELKSKIVRATIRIVTNNKRRVTSYGEIGYKTNRAYCKALTA